MPVKVIPDDADAHQVFQFDFTWAAFQVAAGGNASLTYLGVSGVRLGDGIVIACRDAIPAGVHIFAQGNGVNNLIVNVHNFSGAAFPAVAGDTDFRATVVRP